MKPWQDLTHYAGFDWAKDHHSVVVVEREGHIVATASAAALLAPFVGEHAPYCAAKAGIIGLILSLRADLGKYNVGASVLCPGAVQSQIHG